MLKEVYGRGITKFNDSDLTWKFEVTQMLMAHGLDNLIDDSRPRLVGERNISAVKAWVKDNAKAMSLYLQHLKEVIIELDNMHDGETDVEQFTK